MMAISPFLNIIIINVISAYIYCGRYLHNYKGYIYHLQGSVLNTCIYDLIKI